jgi:nitrous oxidase accessory protein NosD
MIVRRPVFAWLLALSAGSAFAQGVVHVFVSSNGTDTGACTRNAPCRNFAYAVTQVADGGEVVALDTAGYGPVLITKTMSIYAAPGALAFIVAATGSDITVAAPDGRRAHQSVLG